MVEPRNPSIPEDLFQPLYDKMHYPANGERNRLDFFSIPIGGYAPLIRRKIYSDSKKNSKKKSIGNLVSSVMKTKSDTNMYNTNVLPTRVFKLTGISMFFIHEDESYQRENAIDRMILIGSGSIHIRIVDKDYLDMPLSTIPCFNLQWYERFIALQTGLDSILKILEGFGPLSGEHKNQIEVIYNDRKRLLHDNILSECRPISMPIQLTINPYENIFVSLEWNTVVQIKKSVDIGLVLWGLMRRPT